MLDEQLRLAAWAPGMTIAFPSGEDARAWAARLACVDVRPASLADSPAAAALVAHAAAAALAGAGASPFKGAAAAGHAATPVQSCPPSPGRTEASAVGGKRKAEAAGLATPLVQVRAVLWVGTLCCRAAPACAPRVEPFSVSRAGPPCTPSRTARRRPPCPPPSCLPACPQPRAFALITPSLSPACSGDLEQLL